MRSPSVWCSLFAGFIALQTLGCSGKPQSLVPNGGVRQGMSAAYLGPPVSLPPKARAAAEGPPGPSLGPLEGVNTLPNVRVNDPADDAPNQSQSGTTLAIDPSDPRRMVSGYNDCRGFTIPARNGLGGWGY